MTCTVEIERIRLYAHHGVLPQEREVGNLFEVTASLEYPVPANDDISCALNYAEAVEIIKKVMAEPVDLIETVALRLRSALMAAWPFVSGGSVKVAKLSPPISSVNLESVSVTLAW